jgi:hypothetical protein
MYFWITKDNKEYFRKCIFSWFNPFFHFFAGGLKFEERNPFVRGKICCLKIGYKKESMKNLVLIVDNSKKFLENGCKKVKIYKHFICS